MNNVNIINANQKYFLDNYYSWSYDYQKALDDTFIFLTLDSTAVMIKIIADVLVCRLKFIQYICICFTVFNLS